MGPLPLILQLGVIFKINLNEGLFRPFYPQFDESRWPDLDRTKLNDK